MDYSITNKPQINIIGITLRTSNDHAMQDIPPLWQQFYTQNIQHRIPHKKSETIYALYIDYDGDFTQPYSLVIGCEVTSLATIPEGMVGKTVPSATYALFPANGKQPEAIVTTWQHIWASDIQRTYTGDFEVYNVASDSQATIYVAIQ